MGMGSHGSKSLGQLVTLYLQEAENDEREHSAYFPLFILTETYAHRMRPAHN